MKIRTLTAILRSSARLAGALLLLVTATLLLAACTQPASPTVPAEPKISATPLRQAVATAPQDTAPAAGEPDEPATQPSATPPKPLSTAVLTPAVLAPCNPGAQDPNAVFVEDLSLPDGAQLPPDARFNKTWRLRNDGACPWPAGIELVLISGQSFSCPDGVPIPQVAAGREVDISVALTAPSQPGTYEGYWRLRTSEGHLFGAVVFTKIVVAQDAAAPQINSPTAVATATPPTPQPTETPTLPPSPTPVATATASATPEPSPTPAATATMEPDSGCRPPDPRFAALTDQAATLGMPLDCATGPVVNSTGQAQAYWQNVDNADPHLRFRSFVVTREDTSEIYVLDSEDVNTYQAEFSAYPDTWTPAMPDRAEACAPLAAPPGYLVPVKSIGKVWCEQSMWNTIGWPRESAAPVNLAIQETAQGLLIEVTALPLKVYLIAANLDTQTATLQQSP